MRFSFQCERLLACLESEWPLKQKNVKSRIKSATKGRKKISPGVATYCLGGTQLLCFRSHEANIGLAIGVSVCSISIISMRHGRWFRIVRYHSLRRSWIYTIGKTSSVDRSQWVLLEKLSWLNLADVSTYYLYWPPGPKLTGPKWANRTFVYVSMERLSTTKAAYPNQSLHW